MVAFIQIVHDSIKEAIRYNQAFVLQVLLNLFARPLKETQFAESLRALLRISFLMTISLGRSGLEKLIRTFYDPFEDNPYILDQDYLLAISRKDYNPIDFLEPLIEEVVDPLSVVGAALWTNNTQLIDYIVSKYPDVFNQRGNVETLMEEFIDYNQMEAIQQLVRLARPLINFKNCAAKMGKADLLQYLN